MLSLCPPPPYMPSLRAAGVRLAAPPPHPHAPQELAAAQAALAAERNRAGESGSALERAAADHAAAVAGLQAQLAAALKGAEVAEAAAKQQTYDLAAAYRRADKAEAAAAVARSELAAARDATAAAEGRAAEEARKAADAVAHALQERGQLEAQLSAACATRDALMGQLGEAVAGGGGDAPAAPSGARGGRGLATPGCQLASRLRAARALEHCVPVATALPHPRAPRDTSGTAAPCPAPPHVARRRVAA